MARFVRNFITQVAIMPKIYYPDNFKIEAVKHYKMHRNIGATIEKYGIASSTLFKWKKYEENHFSVFQRNLPTPVTKQKRILIS